MEERELEEMVCETCGVDLFEACPATISLNGGARYVWYCEPCLQRLLAFHDEIRARERTDWPETVEFSLWRRVKIPAARHDQMMKHGGVW